MPNSRIASRVTLWQHNQREVRRVIVAWKKLVGDNKRGYNVLYNIEYEFVNHATAELCLMSGASRLYKDQVAYIVNQGGDAKMIRLARTLVGDAELPPTDAPSAYSKNREIARRAIERLKIPDTDWPAKPYLTLDMLDGMK